MGGLIEGAFGFTKGYAKGRELKLRERESGQRILGQRQQMLMQQKQLQMQEQQLEQADKERQIDNVFQYVNALSKAGASEQQIINAMRPLSEFGFDISTVKLDKGQTKEVVKLVGGLWDQYRKGDIDINVLARGVSEKLAEYPKQEKYLKSEMGRVETAREGLLGQQQALKAEQEEIRKFKGKGWLELGEEPVPTGTEEMRFPSAGRMLYAPPPKEEKPEATKRVWDKQAKQYVQKSQAQISADPDRYGMAEPTILKHRRAGAPTIEVLTGRREAISKFGVEKDPGWIPKTVQAFKKRYADWDLMEPDEQENLLMVHVKDTLAGLYKDVHFKRNKKTGEIELWGSGKKLKSWPKKNF